MDITRFLRDLKSGKLKIDTKKIVLLHGSPPCQGFCAANTSGGSNDWQNKQCTLDFLEAVEYIQPPFVSMENVPGLAMKRKIDGAKLNKNYLQQVMGRLISCGYDGSFTMTSTKNFGDPQDRKRLVLLAAKRGYTLPSNPTQTHGGGEGMEAIVSVQDVLQDLEDIEPNCSGRVRLEGSKEHIYAHYIEGTAHSNSNDEDTRLYASHPLAPAKTVRKKNNICHYKLNRYLTTLEYKRLMSFPDGHKLEGTQKEQRDQIGNAVPCKFAEAIGKTIMESYRLGRYSCR